MATVFEGKFRLRGFFPYAIAAESDFDGALVDTEGENLQHGPQAHSWGCVVAGLAIAKVGGWAFQLIYDEVKEIYATSKSSELIVRMFKLLEKERALPEGITTAEQFDVFLRPARARLITRRALPVMPGAKAGLLVLEQAFQHRALCTSSPKDPTVPIAEKAFGKEVFDRIIPPEHRLFREDMKTTDELKPRPGIWLRGLELMGGIPKEHAIIIEDRRDNTEGALHAGFGGAIVVARRHNVGEYAEAFRDWNNVAIVTDLSHIAA